MTILCYAYYSHDRNRVVDIWITGVLFDRSKSYEGAFILIAALVFLAFLAALALQNPETASPQPASKAA